MTMATKSKPATAEKLRRDIDRGRTGDKVAWPDPASAPLGTDEEAAGTPLTRDRVEAARQAERRGPAATQAQAGLGYAWILVALILVLFAAVLIGFIGAA